jgi:hypothetical protein
MVMETTVLASKEHALLSSVRSYSSLVFSSPGGGSEPVPGLGHLILPQCYASGGRDRESDHEMGLKFSVYHGWRTPIWCQSPFVFK